MRDSGRWRVRVQGTVQGVGFRPFVCRSALEMGLAGFVLNTPDGVFIEAQGPLAALERLVARIQEEPPPLARIQHIAHEPIAPMSTPEETFAIAPSTTGAQATTQISPDIAPCDACLAELADAADRRHRYPFINCTNCGPRYTIVEELPYDRPKTTMKAFAMCEPCATEYADPRDRRFHAQPDACAACGPQLTFTRPGNETRAPAPAALDDALAALESGEIVAIKGVGGFHLACDAASDAAVAKLRRRKRRDEKPLAVMVGSLDAARRLCHIDDTEAKLLTSPQRPIVLLRRKSDAAISPHIAPGNKNLGVMLPSTPLHYLLFGGDQQKPEARGQKPETSHESRVPSHGSRVLVMTSGNVTDEPIAFENAEALARLGAIADAFLLHDRPIRTRVDDSIVRLTPRGSRIIRRARGFVPEPVRLSWEMPPILAAGADMKGAICFTRGRSAFLSQHLGDLGNALAHRAFEDAVDHLGRLLEIQPALIACDLHPDYFSSRYARSLATNHQAPITEVQHHHAHVASCMAENDLPNESVIGIALDGAGFGPDGTVWGGEVLVADYAGFTRAARLRPVLMPGGDAAAREPWRMALAWLSPLLCKEETGGGLSSIDPGKQRTVLDMIAKRINCPMTSSCGRLFDAVAALTGVRLVNAFEGQAAMELEQIADGRETGAYDVSIDAAGSPIDIDFAPMFAAIVDDVRRGVSPAAISARFHTTLVEALVAACRRIAGDARFTIRDARVCLSGGCFQNALLSEKLEKRLAAEGFAVYTHSLVPANDGGIALGQAVIAAHNTVAGG